VVQIYAGGNSSFAVLRSGDLLVFGENKLNTLGLIAGTSVFLPMKVPNTPWSMRTTPVIVIGKTQTGYVYSGSVNKERETSVARPTDAGETRRL
jgi:alpha-tubulin suppressor-like RCC1 family protein